MPRERNIWAFDMVDLPEAAQVEIVVDENSKCWVNLNGKCLLRVGVAHDVVVIDGRKRRRGKRAG